MLIEIEKGGDGKSVAVRVYRTGNVPLELVAERTFDHVPSGLTRDFDGTIAYLKLEDCGGF
ncbi:MAG: hypothetical protein L0212_00760 [Acidobacteria bacterium]|nr:hypothetical protein [Acidobacteriota bacterium]